MEKPKIPKEILDDIGRALVIAYRVESKAKSEGGKLLAIGEADAYQKILEAYGGWVESDFTDARNIAKSQTK